MTAAQRYHISQRIKVGAIGLGIVILLILIAGTVLGAVSRERPVGVKTDAVANLALANEADSTEPLADMGVTPTSSNAGAQ